MAITAADVENALRSVIDPDLGKDIVSLGFVKKCEVGDGNVVDLTIELTTPACPLKDKIQADIEQSIHILGAERSETIGDINIEFTADVRSPQQKLADGQDNPIPGVKNVIAVGAGKGGVGKSTVAVNLAVGLARAGATAGLLDGDIYGPSIPTMLGLGRTPAYVGDDNRLRPFEVHGIKTMTIGQLVEPDKPLIWRGPMAHGAFKQLATQTEWGELDYLIVDLPPGTGDVPLTLTQMLPLAGAVVVCTPQRVAQDDARRAVRMFEQLGVSVLGVVENMSYFVCEHGTEYDIFGKGGAEQMAKEMNTPFLGSIPIVSDLRARGDSGDPTSNFEAGGALAEALEGIVKALAAQVSKAAMKSALTQPTMSIE
ncbi:MAG: iron-sulfur cluster carrier protein ApbC [Planctomycetes bacterium]|nr:iron-sulfur cluster carrier protein ApbC [Planctomycetota bacterium]